MITKETIKYVKSLQQKKFRDQYNQFVVEGVKSVDEILQSDFNVLDIFAVEEWIHEREISENIPITCVSEKELGRISGLVSPNQVLAIVAKKEVIYSSENQTGIILILDGIKDPGNLGTIIRSADWFGIKHIICSENCCELHNPKVVQSTMGAICRVDVSYANLIDVLSSKSNSINVIGAVLGGQDIRSINVTNDCIILIGSEASGISEELLPFVTVQAEILGQVGGAESLNAAVAASIFLYHFTQ